MAILAGVVLWRINPQVSIARWVEHSDKVLLHTKDAQLDFGKMLLAFRGYMTSADKAYLDELHEATIAFEKDLEEIATLVTDNS